MGYVKHQRVGVYQEHHDQLRDQEVYEEDGVGSHNDVPTDPVQWLHQRDCSGHTQETCGVSRGSDK